MTLSNVFIGKKVVQQIYMNNALIYQAKGWETLPSTAQEVWTKSYNNFSYFNYCTIDLNNYIYTVSQNSLSKFDTDGTLLWSKTYLGAVKICIDSDNTAYLASLKRPANESGLAVIIDKIDEKGNSTQTAKVNGNSAIDSITNFTIDKDCLYVTTLFQSGSTTYPHLFIIDKKLNLTTVITINSNIGTLIADKKQYLYYATGNKLCRIEKNNLASIETSLTASNGIESLSFDKLGNVVYSSGPDLFKYNIDSKSVSTVKGTTNSYCKQFCIDFQQNLYSINGDIRTNYKINLVKVSSDNTVIYDINIGEELASNILSGRLLVDTNGNIYYLYINNSNQLVIKKFINLVKKGS